MILLAVFCFNTKAQAIDINSEVAIASCTFNTSPNATNTCSVSADGLIGMVGSSTMSAPVAKVTFDPAKKITKAVFDITYEKTPTGWTVDIGDSDTNDGWAGDASTSSNDAEVQIKDSTFSVYGNDSSLPTETLDGHRKIKDVSDLNLAGNTVSITISNNHLGYSFPGSSTASGSIDGHYLYALASQEDTQGPVNNDIYAAFNRVVNGDYRNGTGVTSVTITLYSNDLSIQGPLIKNVVPKIVPTTDSEVVVHPIDNSSTTQVPTKNLIYGLKKSEDVRKLQEILIDKGYLSGVPTGNFLDKTRVAVKAFQKERGLPTTGFVGPMTREELTKSVMKVSPLSSYHNWQE